MICFDTFVVKYSVLDINKVLRELVGCHQQTVVEFDQVQRLLLTPTVSEQWSRISANGDVRLNR